MQYNSKIQLGRVVLNVENLEQQVDFYTEKVGLVIKNETDQMVDLGIENSAEVLVSLNKVIDLNNNMAGLYHIALLVPKRKDLGNILKHLLDSGVALQGGSDHGVSEAIYFSDTEGNGIEIYRDKEISEWDIDGETVNMVTEPLAVQEILALAENIDSYKLPIGTIMGHVHLSVPNALATSIEYQNLFAMGEKLKMPTASWIASGQYHHHLAFNSWARGQVERLENYAGLNRLTINLTSAEEFFAVEERLAQSTFFKIIKATKDYLLIEDSNGIRTEIRNRAL